MSDGWNAFWGVEDDGSMYGDLEAVLNKNTSFGNDDYVDVKDEITERAGVDSLEKLKDKWLDSYNFLVRLKEEGMSVN